MAQLEDRLAFSKRLNHALDLHGTPPKGKGRQVLVGKMFGVSQKAANKWLEALSLPSTMRIAEIAEKLNVNTEWLTYGTGPINIEPLPGADNSRWRRVPVIAWEQVKDYENFDAGSATKWVWTDAECGPKTFALVVRDDSMMPRYEPGATIIVDPDREPEHRLITVFQWKKTGDISCAQYLVDGPNQYLKPHNSDYKTVLIDSVEPQVKICGIVRQILMTY